MELSIVIPAYNEEKRLPLTLQRIFEYLSMHYGGQYEIIVVDDGSTDKTVEVVNKYRRHYRHLRLLRFRENQGRGAAVRAGILKTEGKFILETDADGSVNEHAIVDFLNYFSKHQELDVLTGSRTVEGSRILTPQPFLRKIFGYSFFFLTKVFFGWPIMDRINGFKMYRREAAFDIFNYAYEKGFFAKAEIVYVAEKRGWQVTELPILWTEHKGSKVRPVMDSLDSLLGIFRILSRDRKGIYKQNIKQDNLTRFDVDKTDIKSANDFKRVLITGGCGFIPSNFVRLFYHEHPDTQIVNLDLLTYAGNPDNLRDIEALEEESSNKRYTFVHGDICDEQLLDELFTKHKFDMVIHMAAESHVDRSILSSVDFIRTNIEGTRALIEVSRKYGVQRFVHISTDEVYGDITESYSSEEWALNPSNPYSASKAGGDHLILSYIRTYGFPAVIVRGSNNYGPYQYPEKLLSLAITNFLVGQKIGIHGYGAQIRSFVHVQDFCRAIDMIAWGDPKHKVYNIEGEEKTVLGALELIAKHMNKNLDEHRFHVDHRPGADMRYAVDGNRIINEFGWAPEKTFEEGIRDTITWYTNNPEWWQKVRDKEGFTEHIKRQAKGQWT